MKTILARHLFFIISLLLHLNHLKAADIPFFFDRNVPDEDDFRQHLYLIDSANSITYDQIKKPEFQKELINIPHNASVPIVPKAVYWFKVIFNENFSNDVILKSHASYKVMAYYYYKNNVLHTGEAGLGVDFNTRQLKENYISFLIPKPSKYDTMYVKIQLSDFNAGPGIELNSLDSYINNLLKSYFSYGIFYGICFIVFIYNFVLYIYSKETLYFYYVIYLVSLVAFSAADWGFVAMLPMMKHLEFNTLYYAIPYNMMTISIILYIKSFLLFKVYHRKFNLLFNALIIYKTMTLILYIIWPNAIFISQYHDALVLTIVLFVLIYWVYLGKKSAKIILVGLLTLITAYWIHSNDDLINQGILGKYLQNIGERSMFYNLLILETIIFAFAIGYRYRILKNEKEKVLTALLKIKDMVNANLQQQVQERTKLIEKQADELKRMNELLQKQNITLKSEVKQKTETIIQNKPIGFEEFKKIFPDETSCYTYLSEIKWKKGFVCKKCANTKFSLMEDNLTRRCTRCRTVHSVTSDTIFHKLKFPIDKAFYILFLATSGKKFTIEQISETIHLRKETCWAFRKKIEHTMEEKKYQKNIDIVWSDLIL